jgi:hypothetical protein
MRIHDTGLNIALVQIIIIIILMASSMLLASTFDRLCFVHFIYQPVRICICSILSRVKTSEVHLDPSLN